MHIENVENNQVEIGIRKKKTNHGGEKKKYLSSRLPVHHDGG